MKIKSCKKRRWVEWRNQIALPSKCHIFSMLFIFIFIFFLYFFCSLLPASTLSLAFKKRHIHFLKPICFPESSNPHQPVCARLSASQHLLLLLLLALCSADFAPTCHAPQCCHLQYKDTDFAFHLYAAFFSSISCYT